MPSIYVAPWVFNQNHKNEALPDLSSREVFAITMRAYFHGMEIDVDQAQILTRYPLRNTINRYYATPDQDFVLEVRQRPGQRPEAVAILFGYGYWRAGRAGESRKKS